MQSMSQLPDSDRIDRETFVGCLGKIIGDSQTASSLFKAFDKESNGSLSFGEYATGVGKLCKGKKVVKLECKNDRTFIDIQLPFRCSKKETLSKVCSLLR